MQRLERFVVDLRLSLAEIKTELRTAASVTSAAVLALMGVLGWYCILVNGQQSTINVNTERILNMQRTVSDMDARLGLHGSVLNELSHRMDQLEAKQK